MQDELISDLLESNNELSFELIVKNQIIEKLRKDIAAFKGNKKTTKTISKKQTKKSRKKIKNIIKEIRKQKLVFEKEFSAQTNLVNALKADCDFIKSIELKSLSDKTNQEDVAEINEKLKSIIMKLHEKSREYIDTTCNISTQTDFNPMITMKIFNELNEICQKNLSSQKHLEILKRKEVVNEQAFYEAFEKRQMCYEQFQIIAKNKKNSLKLIIENDRVGATDLVVADKNKNDCEVLQASSSSVSENLSCQTLISTLHIGIDFGEILPSDNIDLQIRKFNGRLIKLAQMEQNFEMEFDRLKCYCDDLKTDKEIFVLESDLNHELKLEIKINQLIDSIHVQKSEIKKYERTLQNYKKKYGKFEDDMQFVNSVPNKFSSASTDENYHYLQSVSEKVTSIHTKLHKLLENIAKSKQRTITVQQLDKLIGKISNQRESILKDFAIEKFSSLIEIYKTDFDFAESIQFPDISDATLQDEVDQNWKKCKKINYRLTAIRTKFNDFIKQQKELNSTNFGTNVKDTATLVHQVTGVYSIPRNKEQEKRKSNDLGMIDLSKSEYELLLQQKDQTIDEYLSVLDSHIHPYLVTIL